MGKLSLITVPVKTIFKGAAKLLNSNSPTANKLLTAGGMFAGWEYLKKNGGIVNEAGKGILGENVNNKIRTTVADKFNGADNPQQQTQAGIAQGQQMAQEGYQMEQGAPMAAQDPYAMQADGVRNFMGSMTGSNGSSPISMLNNFTGNLFSGNVSASNIAGLMLGAWMMFRMSIWGKLGGALLSMMMIGKNSQQQMPTQQMQPGLAQGNGLTQQPPLDVADGVGMRR